MKLLAILVLLSNCQALAPEHWCAYRSPSWHRDLAECKAMSLDGDGWRHDDIFEDCMKGKGYALSVKGACVEVK